MSLERKDVRFKLSPEDHEALSVVADVDELDLGEWVEQVVMAEVRRRVHRASVIAAKTARWGRSGKNRELQGIAGSGGE